MYTVPIISPIVIKQFFRAFSTVEGSDSVVIIRAHCAPCPPSTVSATTDHRGKVALSRLIGWSEPPLIHGGTIDGKNFVVVEPEDERPDLPQVLNSPSNHNSPSPPANLANLSKEGSPSPTPESNSSKEATSPSLDTPNVDNPHSHPPEEDSSPDHEDEPSDKFYTERYEYAVVGEDSHGTVKGKRRVFQKCEDEPIHIPGAIQSFGMLVALKEEDDGALVVRIASENVETLCHYTPTQLFALPTFLDAVSASQRSQFIGHAKTVQTQYKKSSVTAEPRVFPITLADPKGIDIQMWCAMHFVGDSQNLLVCEFEQQQDTSSLAALAEADFPMVPVSTLDSDRLHDTTNPSLITNSQPLEFSKLHDLQTGEGRVLEMVGVMSNIQQQLTSVETVTDLLDTIAGIVKDLTKFHRVMIYQFDRQKNGIVAAEVIDPRASQDVYMGLHFPASDIPEQARALYRINKVRLLFDRESQPARLVCRTIDDLSTPLNLTHSYLRAMSPVHLKYLKNMGVQSSLSISLDSKNELWGLICCHSYGTIGTKVSFPIREICYWVGLCASTCLQKLLHAKSLQSRKVIDTIRTEISPNSCIAASSDDILALFSADFGLLVVKGEARAIGKLASYREAVTLLRYVYFRKFTNIISSNNISTDFTDIKYSPGFQMIAGLLFVPLSGEGSDFILFFRKDQSKEVNWAGNPYASPKQYGRLEPRDSFQKWTELVHGTSIEWTEDQLDTATILRIVYGKFIEVWRQKEAMIQETRLKRMLLLNTSHELFQLTLQVRTPLNAVINYLEIAMEKPLDPSTQDMLSKSHSASKSLIYVIDDLLHLTQSREDEPLLEEGYDIKAAIEEVIAPLKNHALTKSLTFRVAEQLGFPQFVRGDRRGLQSAVSALISNAIIYTSSGSIVVELRQIAANNMECELEIAVEDTGPGMSEQQLDTLFQELEQVSDENESNTGTQEPEECTALRQRQALQIGLGLSLVARFVRIRNGQLRVISKVFKGSTFTLRVPFTLCSEASHPLQTHHFEQYLHPGMNIAFPGSLPRRWSITSSSSGSVHDPSMKTIEYYSQRVDQPKSVLRNSNPRDLLPKIPLMILIAEDNPVNVQILQKRLEKMGHETKVSRDGKECYNVFRSNRRSVDLILMDLGMPIVDGFTSTRMIRSLEDQHPITLSETAEGVDRVAIFAVSASLFKEKQPMYIEAGFDGWVLKPVDFKRLVELMAGVLDINKRRNSKPVDFAKGGWFQAPPKSIGSQPPPKSIESQPPL
ncbi:MAG: Light-sensor Protein kinase [Cirrosporium novae-zelandiae]|nr:MAG: Light-sensor Protein kinase [Cirrosporium novae-zelandiae]